MNDKTTAKSTEKKFIYQVNEDWLALRREEPIDPHRRSSIRTIISGIAVKLSVRRLKAREDAFFHFAVAGFVPAIHAAATTRKPCGEGQQ